METDTRCRRNVNCNCKICITSFISTLDLLPVTTQRMYIITNFSSLKPSPPETPTSFSSSTISTPKPPKSRFRNNLLRLKIKKNRKALVVSDLTMVMRWAFILGLILLGKLGFSNVSSKIRKTKLTPEIVRNLSEKSLGYQDVKERLRLLSNEVQFLVGVGVPKNPICDKIQDGLNLRSRCRLYESGTEEVSIWGSPLQMVGLLKTEYDSRSFTILSGRVTEWSIGKLSCFIRKENTSWEQGKWSASLWRLDENTWILEYKRSFVSDNSRPFASGMEFLKFKIMRAFQWVTRFNSVDHHLAPT